MKGFSLGNSEVTVEGEAILSSGPGHHGKPAPVRPEGLDRPGTDPIPRNNIRSSVLVQGAIRLLEVKEYLEEDRLPYGHNTLEKLGLNGSGSFPTALPKPVHNVMERDGCSEISVQKAGDSLPKHLYHANTPEVFSSPLGNKYDCMPSSLLFQCLVKEICLKYCNNLMLVGGVRHAVLHCLVQPLVELFRLHYRWTAQAVQEKPAHRPGDLLVFQYGVLNE